MSYSYDAAEVWIEDLSDDDHPMTHDLCARHVETFKPPHGWDLSDRRSARVTLLHGRSNHGSGGYRRFGAG